MTTRFWLIRHGPTHSRVMTPPDAPADLSDTAALARLSAALPQAPVIASPLLRAQQTAAAIAFGRPLLPPDPGLAEFDHGAWTGLGWEEIAARWPDLSRAYWTTPGPHAPPGGESWDQGAARVCATLDRLAGTAPDLILVAHHGAILTQLARATGQSPALVLAQPIAPLSLTCLTRSASGWQAGPINHCP